MTCGIYKITRKDTGQSYIGLSKNIENRYYEHSHRHNMDSRIDRAMVKHGADKFDLETIEELPYDIPLLKERERYWIVHYNTYEDDFHYNLTPGGDVPPMKKDDKHSYESCMKMSKDRNSIGYFRVYLSKDKYRYRWYENGKRCSISAKDINVLKQKAMERGLHWEQISDNPDTPSLYKGRTLSIEQKIKKSKQQNTTGYYRVIIQQEKNRKPRYVYSWRENNKRKRLSSVDINKLEEKVKSKGLPWYKLKD